MHLLQKLYPLKSSGVHQLTGMHNFWGKNWKKCFGIFLQFISHVFYKNTIIFNEPQYS